MDENIAVCDALHDSATIHSSEPRPITSSGSADLALQSLNDHDRADLERSGMSTAMIAQMQIRSAGAGEVQRLTGNRPPGGDGGYVIPYLDECAQPTGFFRVRLRAPGEHGARYFSAIGAEWDLYLPPGLSGLLAERDLLVITEGEKKAARAAQAGIPCVAIPGVTMWHAPSARGWGQSPETPLLGAIRSLTRERRVVVLADSDAAAKVQVRRAMTNLARAIRHQVPTRAIQFTHVPQEYGGLDDWLQAVEDEAAVDAYLDEAAQGRIEPGLRTVVPYDRCPEQAGGGLLRSGCLSYALPYAAADEPVRPGWIKEVLRDAEGGLQVRRERAPGAMPHVWLEHTLRVLPVDGGRAITDDPDRVAEEIPELAGITDTGSRIRRPFAADEIEARHLLKLGVTCDRRGVEELWRLLNAAKQQREAGVRDVVRERGWVRAPGESIPTYLYGDRAIAPERGRSLEPLRAGRDGGAVQGIGESGSSAEQVRLLRLAMRNPGVAALLGFAAAAPLLARLEGTEPGLIHLYGASGAGKSTLLRVVASLLATPVGTHDPTSYLLTFRSTDNGLEAPLRARNDAPVLIDEIHALPRRTDLLSKLYMIANGAGKQRMSRCGEPRPDAHWRAQIISSGEVSIAQKLDERGVSTAPGGLQFRTIDLPVDAVGLWSDLEHEAERPGAGAYGGLVEDAGDAAPGARRVIEALETGLQRHHGHIWPCWIRSLQDPERLECVRASYRDYVEQLTRSLPAGASRVLRRRVKHGAIALAALEHLAHLLGIDPQDWLPEVAGWIQSQLLPAGLERTVGEEADDLVEAAHAWIQSHRGRFYHPGEPVSSVHERVGWLSKLNSSPDQRRPARVCLTSRGLGEIARDCGIDRNRLRRALLGAGWSEPRGGSMQAPHSQGKQRCIYRDDLLEFPAPAPEFEDA